MASSHPPDARETQQQLDSLTASLAASLDQLKAQGDAFLQSSNLKTSLGDHAGALDGAKRALALFPADVRYLIRVSQALLQCGRPDKAYKALQDAQSAAHAGRCDDATLAVLAALDRQLRPLHYLPDELLSLIFEHVYADWARLLSPFQLPHVSQRWRKLAAATPTLWRDMRILRKDEKARVDRMLLFHPVRKAFCFVAAKPDPNFNYNRQDNHQYNLVHMVSVLSRNTLSHFECVLHYRDEWGSVIELVVERIAGASSATIESISIVDKNQETRLRYSGEGRDRARGSVLAAVAMDIVLRCPRLRHVELCVGELLFEPPRRRRTLRQEEPSDTQFDFKCLQPPSTDASPFLSVKIDSFDGFNMSRGAQVRGLFLQRCSQIRSLSLHNVPAVLPFLDPSTRPPFALQLLATCAQTLLELEVKGANVFAGNLLAGIPFFFPHLRHFRHVAFERSFNDYPEMQKLAMPNLESIEAPSYIVSRLPRVPERVTIRLDCRETYEEDCREIAHWLDTLSSGEETSPRSLTIMVTFQGPDPGSLNDVIAILTPSTTNEVVCRNLDNFAILCRAPFARDATGACFSLHPVPLPAPVTHEQWEKNKVNASSLAKMEAERRLLSEGLHYRPVKPLPNRAASAPPLWASESDVTPVEGGTGGGRRCVALDSIQIEGCFVQQDVWQIMKASKCSFSVFPDPDEMVKLPSEEEYNANRTFGHPKEYSL